MNILATHSVSSATRRRFSIFDFDSNTTEMCACRIPDKKAIHQNPSENQPNKRQKNKDTPFPLRPPPQRTQKYPPPPKKKKANQKRSKTNKNTTQHSTTQTQHNKTKQNKTKRKQNQNKYTQKAHPKLNTCLPARSQKCLTVPLF